MKTSFWNIVGLIAFTLLAQILVSAIPAYGAGADSPATVNEKPVIANGPVAKNIIDRGASIGWASGEPMHMRVRFGTDPAHLDQIADAVEKAEGRIHYASLSGLKPDTRYFFQVATQSDNPIGSIGTFRTLPTPPAAVQRHRRPPPVMGR
jgi:hypothetical protein